MKKIFDKFKKKYLQSLAKYIVLPEEYQALESSREFFRKIISSMPGEKWVMSELQDGTMIYLDLLDHGVSLGALFDQYELEETGFILGALSSGSVFVDIGANIGWYSLKASKIVGEKGRVIAFEPRLSTFLHLKKSIDLNGFKNIEVHNTALSNIPGEGTLEWNTSINNPGSSRLVRQSQQSFSSQNVTVSTLDQILDTGREIDFVKIDVEGAEPLVFQGAASTLKRTKPMILSEISPEYLKHVSNSSVWDYLSQMGQYGYSCYLLENGQIGTRIKDWPSIERDVLNVVFVQSNG